MNQYSQQPAQYQGGQQQQFSNAGQNFQPSGFVQSHYQGQLSYPSFGRESQSIVSPSYNNAGSQHSSYGYQQHAAPAIHSYSQPAVSNHAYQSHGPVQSHASSPATAFGDVGPVIARYGYQAGPDAQNQSFSQQQYGQQSYQPAQYSQQSYGQAGYQSHGPVHSNTSINPVYQATNAYEQSGPVIARYGYQSSSAQSNQYSR
ncbi:hypothetical protein [Paenibacillus sp. NPDC057967]|uniref:hypothetical protein n=1 Tax=Paenibacillus sp. NPDC057967 TaxID=3346293 RepID=UPI0036D7C945